LSQRRAETVAQYLAAHGVPEDLMHAEGRGKSEPVVQCSEQARRKLIECLAPNRRVVVRVK
jgi:OmpA-OmpF porin, OOP family